MGCGQCRIGWLCLTPVTVCDYRIGLVRLTAGKI
jgi:hypothetical protein